MSNRRLNLLNSYAKIVDKYVKKAVKISGSNISNWYSCLVRIIGGIKRLTHRYQNPDMAELPSNLCRNQEIC
jgi:hypothetical protein